MPELSRYINELCKNNNLKEPSVFIATNKGFLNALAAKVLGVGSIVIGKEIIEKASDEEVEGVIAHELGHIKYNHSAKNVALSLAVYATAAFLTETFITDDKVKGLLPPFLLKYITPSRIKTVLIGSATALLPSLIINKRFELQADEFACEVGKGKGFIQFLERAEQMNENFEQQLEENYELLNDPNNQLDRIDDIYFHVRCFTENFLHYLNKWLANNTFLGDHPSHQDRVKAIETYLAKQ